MKRLVVGLLAAGAVLVSASPVWAQTPPTPTGTVAPIPGILEPDPCAKWLNPQNAADALSLQQCRLAHPEYHVRKPSVDLENEMIPGDVGARYPLSNYDLGFDNGNPGDVGRKFEGTLMTVGWTVLDFLIRVGLASVSWAFSFSIASKLAAPAAQVSQAFSAHLIGPLGIGYYALFILAAVGGYHLFRGRTTKAFGELATTLVLFAVFGVILADPAGYFNGAVGTVSDVSAQILSAGIPAGAPQTVAAPTNQFDHPEIAANLVPLKASISNALIDVPYDQLNWSEPLTGRCAQIRDAILSSGPWGSDNQPRDAMRSAPECAKYADFNADPANGNRWAWTWFFVFLAIFVDFLLIPIAIAVVGAQVVGVLLIAVLSIVAALALLPGHRAAWKWSTAAMKAAGTILAMSALLVIFVIFFGSGLKASATWSPFDKMGTLGGVVVGSIMAKRHFLAGAARGAAGMGAKLASAGGGAAAMGVAGSVSKPHHVLRTFGKVASVGSAGVYFARKLPGRIDKVALKGIGAAKPLANAAGEIAAQGSKVAGQIGQGGSALLLAGAVPVHNRLAAAQERLAAAREERRAIRPGALSDYMAGEAFQESQARAAREARNVKIREGLQRVAADRAQAQALAEQQAAQVAAQDQARQEFHARAQAGAIRAADKAASRVRLGEFKDQKTARDRLRDYRERRKL